MPASAKKKTKSQSSASASVRKSAKTAAQKPAEPAERLKMTEQERHTWSIVMLAVAVLMLFVLLIPGQNIWLSIHNFFFSLFGISSWVLCLLMIYMAFVIALDVRTAHAGGKVAQIFLICAFLCALIFSCSADAAQGLPFGVMSREVWEAKNPLGSGWIGVLIGWPLSESCGKAPAIIIEVVAIIVLFAIMSGKGILNIVECRRRVKERRAQRLEERRQAEAATISVDGFEIPKEATAAAQLNKPVGKTRSETPKKQTFNTDIPFEVDGVAQPPLPANDDPAQLDQAIRSFNAPFGKKADPAPVPVPAAVTAPEEEPPFDVEPAVPAVSKPEKTEKPSDPALDTVIGQASAHVEAQQAAQEAAGSAVVEIKDRDYKTPPVSLLREPQKRDTTLLADELKATAESLVDVLRSFGVETRVVNISCGPAVTRYELQPSAGVKISKITNLSNDIALALAAQSVRIEAPIPGKAAVGIEIPNKTVSMVNIREILESDAFWSAKSNITVALGKDITGNVMVGDLGKMPHLLIAGSTGSGKSVCINSFLISLLYKAKPADVRLLLIDPKQVELQSYNGIPHLLIPVVTDPKKAAGALAWAVNEMLTRYKLFAEHNVRDLNGYNEKARNTDGLEPLPQIVVVIDELADLMMVAHNDVEDSICRLAQMARAAGMHLVIATQRPSVDVITGIIKANVPSRIAFAVASQIDSRTILDNSGAEKLLGRGDMLYNPIGMQKPLRLQGCFVSDHEVESVVGFVKENSDCNYDSDVEREIEQAAAQRSKEKGDEGGGSDGGGSDDMMTNAIDVVVEAGMASTSLLQRRLRIGYGRAARIIDEMEERGIVGPMEGSKARTVLLTRQQWYEMKMRLENE